MNIKACLSALTIELYCLFLNFFIMAKIIVDLFN